MSRFSVFLFCSVISNEAPFVKICCDSPHFVDVLAVAANPHLSHILKDCREEVLLEAFDFK